MLKESLHQVSVKFVRWVKQDLPDGLVVGRAERSAYLVEWFEFPRRIGDRSFHQLAERCC